MFFAQLILAVAYASACNETIPAILTTLTLPPGWDGPFGQGLTPATTAVTLIAALVIGTSCIGLLIQM